MSSIDKATALKLVNSGPDRTLVGGKQLTLAFGGVYIASTNLKAKPLLVWEADSGYARYHVPTETLHPSILAKLSDKKFNGVSGGDGVDVKLETVDTVTGSNGSAAVIERLSIGTKTTTWLRFTEGPLKGQVRFEPKDLDAWFENGAIFMGIKNPYKRIDTNPVANHVVVRVDGQTVAETTAPVILNETGLKDAYYLPATSVLNWGGIDKSDWRTQCPYKGEAWYFNLTVNGKKHENAIWYYPYPTHESAGVEGFLSFYNREGTEITVDGVKLNDIYRESSGRGMTTGKGMINAVPTDGSLQYRWSRL